MGKGMGVQELIRLEDSYEQGVFRKDLHLRGAYGAPSPSSWIGCLESPRLVGGMPLTEGTESGLGACWDGPVVEGGLFFG